jgi:DNA (cytosine-5)-methyltransferase 1
LDKKLPEVIDLFSGCGGLALGFQRAGFNVTYGIEIMEAAVETASYNLDWRNGKETKHICGDITQMDFMDIKKFIGKNGCIVIGGPPCQAYSLAGRAKLRSLGESRENTNDKRGYLYQDFLRYAIGLEARAIVMENVPEATDYGGMNIPQEVCEILEKENYTAAWTVLNAADYGVPQIRERLFVIAVKKGEKKDFELPVPTNISADNKKTPNQQRFKSFSKFPNFVMPKQPGVKLSHWVTVSEAISDLPVLFPNAYGKYQSNKINTPMKYTSSPQNEYQKTMREWFGFDLGVVTGNCFRKTSRDFPIFSEMQQGDDYIEASKLRTEFLKRHVLQGE